MYRSTGAPWSEGAFQVARIEEGVVRVRVGGPGVAGASDAVRISKNGVQGDSPSALRARTRAKKRSPGRRDETTCEKELACEAGRLTLCTSPRAAVGGSLRLMLDVHGMGQRWNCRDRDWKDGDPGDRHSCSFQHDRL